MIRRRRGFTLIELIIVMAIIGILAGLVMTAAMSAKRRATMTKARAAIAGLETALGMFQLDIGAYPSSTNAMLVRCLTTNNTCTIYTSGAGGSAPMSAAQIAAWSGPYANFQANEINATNQYIDPWGNAYVYNVPGTGHGTGAVYTNYVDIYSWGPDGANNNGDPDDICNWRRN